MTTALAVKEIRYPHETWVLDDGNRAEMREAAQAAGIGYLTRSENWKDRPRHAKAGNLNNALFATSGEFMMILDADQIPDPAILDKTLGWFGDDRVALVQTPQYFTNVPDEDPLGSQAPLFYGPIQQGKDGWNAAFFCGSNAVLRREALMQIGVVGYVREVERAVREALKAADKVLRNARKAAGAGTGRRRGGRGPVQRRLAGSQGAGGRGTGVGGDVPLPASSTSTTPLGRSSRPTCLRCTLTSRGSRTCSRSTPSSVCRSSTTRRWPRWPPARPRRCRPSRQFRRWSARSTSTARTRRSRSCPWPPSRSPRTWPPRCGCTRTARRLSTTTRCPPTGSGRRTSRRCCTSACAGRRARCRCCSRRTPSPSRA